MVRRKKSSMTSGRSSGVRSLRAVRNVTVCCSKKWKMASLVELSTCSAPEENSRTIESVAQRKQPCLDVVKPEASISASCGRRGIIPLRYDKTILRQHRQTRSSMGVKSENASTNLARTGKTSWQYCTAGFVCDGST